MSIITFPILEKGRLVSVQWSRIPDANTVPISVSNPVMGKSGRPSNRKEFVAEYILLSETDKASLQAFERYTVMFGAVPFLWQEPISQKTYSVRFSELLNFNSVLGKEVRYNVSVKMYGFGDFGYGLFGSGIFGY